MSTLKRTSKSGSVYSKYIKSGKWFNRRKKYFQDYENYVGEKPSCLVCDTTKSLQLHHLSYKNSMRQDSNGFWVFIAEERNEELMILCKEHHLWLHGYFDTHPREAKHQDRKTASIALVKKMRLTHERNN